jgi:uncharacterized protein (DUF1499 family)
MPPKPGAGKALRSAGRVSGLALAGLLLATGAPSLGAEEGVGTQAAIAACGSAPNCVSSINRDEGRRVRALGFDTTPERAWAMLKQALLQEPRMRVIDEKPDPRYVHAESSSLVFGFVDDVEFLLVPGDTQIQVRSASRVGYWDLGVNRRRVERIRERFATLLAIP